MDSCDTSEPTEMSYNSSNVNKAEKNTDWLHNLIWI